MDGREDRGWRNPSGHPRGRFLASPRRWRSCATSVRRSISAAPHPPMALLSGLLVVFGEGPGSARSDLKMEHVDPGRLRISAARRQGDVHPARGWVRHRRQGRALGHSVDQAWCAAPAARMGPPLTESPGRCRVDERGSCGEPHGGHHAARCASCARAQGLAGTVRGIRCRHGVLLRRCASGAPSRHRGDGAGKDRAGHCCGG